MQHGAGLVSRVANC